MSIIDLEEVGFIEAPEPEPENVRTSYFIYRGLGGQALKGNPYAELEQEYRSLHPEQFRPSRTRLAATKLAKLVR